MIKKSSDSIQTTRAPREYFTGTVWLDRLVSNPDLSCEVAKVTFEPTARTYWHTHPAGQILLVTSGKGCIQKKGEPIQTLLPGDTVIIAAGEEHWHGAATDSIFSHIAIQPVSPIGENMTWLNEVTDDIYMDIKK